jgi:lysyl-tRNA synthetase class 2
MFRTRTGEASLHVEAFEVLAKALLPLPEKWHGLRDVEIRYRQRYLDLIANPAVREVFITRSRIVTAIRRFLDERGFLEVETPVLQPLYGGAAARPFTTYHNALDRTLYLRIADELYLKRLIIGGLDRVYEIGLNFRNEGISTEHNPEFTVIELYQAYADYHDIMRLVEEIYATVAQEVLGTTRITYQGKAIDLTPPWRRVTMRDAILEHTGVDIEAHRDLEALWRVARERDLPVGKKPTWGKMVEEIFSACVEPTLIQPTFVLDFPVEVSPLAKKKPDAPHLVERFEFFIGTLECGNAFSELNDPLDQRERFEAQRRDAAAGDEEAHPLDEDFLTAVEHGMPPTGGLGFGIDRMVMLFTDQPSIREVILFPQLRSRE